MLPFMIVTLEIWLCWRYIPKLIKMILKNKRRMPVTVIPQKWNILIYCSNVLGLPLTSYWTSGTDQAEEGKFVWMSSGKPVIFSRWATNEPNNIDSVEHCMTIWKFSDKILWNDYICSHPLYYICEDIPDCSKPIVFDITLD